MVLCNRCLGSGTCSMHPLIAWSKNEPHKATGPACTHNPSSALLWKLNIDGKSNKSILMFSTQKKVYISTFCCSRRCIELIVSIPAAPAAPALANSGLHVSVSHQRLTSGLYSQPESLHHVSILDVSLSIRC